MLNFIPFLFLDIHDIAELLEAFMLNRTLPREHFRKKLTDVFKPILLEKWLDEVTYHQRLLVNLAKNFFDL